jgi:nuclear pore complex protein Nup98-Nup96
MYLNPAIEFQRHQFAKHIPPLQWPYTKKPKTFAGTEKEMSQFDARFHHSFKPRWTGFDQLVAAADLSSDSEMVLDGEGLQDMERRQLKYHTVDPHQEVSPNPWNLVSVVQMN